MKKMKFNVERSKQQIRKIKKQTWFKPVCLILVAALIVVLILSSAAVARYSANLKVTSIAAEYGVDYASSSGEGNADAYDFYYEDDENTSKESGIMVKIGSLYNRIKGDDTQDHEVEINAEADTQNDFQNGLAKEMQLLEERITENVKSQVENTNAEIIEGASGKDGEAGEKGERGETGARGPAGPAGQTGAAGKTGSVGATGEKGETGEAGKDGMSTFIVYADTTTGKNMSMTPLETSKYIGTYQGLERSPDPKDYTWTEYKDKIITYTNDDGKPTIHIFN